jgi:hypothetical protein
MYNHSPGSNNTSTNDQANHNTTGNTSPDLSNESFADSSIVLRSESLFEEGKENRYDNAGLQALTEADEED